MRLFTTEDVSWQPLPPTGFFPAAKSKNENELPGAASKNRKHRNRRGRNLGQTRGGPQKPRSDTSQIGKRKLGNNNQHIERSRCQDEKKYRYQPITPEKTMVRCADVVQNANYTKLHHGQTN